MDLFEEIKCDGYEQVLVFSDAASGLEAIIAIHSTRLGPALGGCRMWPYPSFDMAMRDVLRLSKAMTYKAAMSDLPLGGGKAVIVGDPRTDKTEPLMLAFAKQVGSLAGRYIVAEDVGIGMADIELFRRVTPHVAGFKQEAGGTGDPSPSTALGVFYGMRACLEEVFGNPSFAGRRVAIQGMGKVGYALAKLLHQESANLIISDMDPERVASGCRDFDADPIHPHEIYRVDCDLFAPCAMGGILNERTIPALSCKIVAGSANNQLEDDHAATALQKRGILYAPDYLINAGGLIQVARYPALAGRQEQDRNAVTDQKIKKIYHRLKEIFFMARANGMPPSDAADCMAEQKLSQQRQKETTA